MDLPDESALVRQGLGRAIFQLMARPLFPPLDVPQATLMITSSPPDSLGRSGAPWWPAPPLGSNTTAASFEGRFFTSFERSRDPRPFFSAEIGLRLARIIPPIVAGMLRDPSPFR